MLALSSAAFAFQAPAMHFSAPAVARSAAPVATIFDDGMTQFKSDFPWRECSLITRNHALPRSLLRRCAILSLSLSDACCVILRVLSVAKYGFGPSVKAERWNGRHAMFGWFMIVGTAYAKGHGFFPDPAVALQYKDWGALTQMGFGQAISNERAIIMMAHVHALGVSMAAAFGPQVLGDTLTLLDGEADEEPYGLLPPFKGQTGLTPAAEVRAAARRTASKRERTGGSRREAHPSHHPFFPVLTSSAAAVCPHLRCTTGAWPWVALSCSLRPAWRPARTSWRWSTLAPAASSATRRSADLVSGL